MKKCPMSYACHAKSDESSGLGPHLYTRESARLSVLAGLLLVLARLQCTFLRLFLFYILASTQVHSTLLFQYPTWSVCSACVRRWTRITRTSLAPQTNPFPTPTPHDQCAVPLCASEHERLWHPNPNATWSVCSACVCASEHEHCWHPTPPLWSPVCIEYCVHRCGKNGKKWYKTLWAQMNQLFAHSFINLLYLLRLPRQRTQLQKRTERRWEMVRTYLHKNALQDQFSRDHSLKRRIKELLWAKSTRRHEPLVNPALAVTVVGHTSCLVVPGS